MFTSSLFAYISHRLLLQLPQGNTLLDFSFIYCELKAPAAWWAARYPSNLRTWKGLVCIEQALEALELAGDADLLRRPAFLASHVALLEAVGEVNKAREAVDGAIAAQESRPSGKSKQEKKAQSAAQAFLYQTLSRLQLKVRAYVHIGDIVAVQRQYLARCACRYFNIISVSSIQAFGGASSKAVFRRSLKYGGRAAMLAFACKPLR